jgi:uncharacterized membrane protein YgcG
MSAIAIREQEAVFDERILDRWGNEFRFDHVKGLSEWLKNSIDAYIRAGVRDDESYVFVKFVVRQGRTPNEIHCIDFVGMTHDEIVSAFRRWGDPDAAGRKRFRTYGGHGNGGKFYMRQMFTRSRFVTWRDGRLNIFGFNERRKYGFAEGFENVRMSPQKVMKLAGIDGLKLPEPIVQRLGRGECGFTVVVGEGLKRAQRKNSAKSIISRLRVHPQARRLILRYPVYVLLNDEAEGQRIEPEPITPKVGFEGPFEFDIPATLMHAGEEVAMENDTYPSGKLVLRTSDEPFAPQGERGVLNTIDIMGQMGVVASYRMHELGILTNPAQVEFIYGECHCPILEDPEEDCVRNDREKLVDNERTRALRDWMRQKVNWLADEMAEKVAEEQREQELKRSSEFNDLLNTWKNKFMSRLYAEIFSGPGSGSGFGGTGGGGSGGRDRGSGGNKGGGGEIEGDGGGSGDQRDKAPKFPLVLLSNFDPDPLHTETGKSVNCDPRHPPVYQREEDVSACIYWINTTAPFARKILDVYGAESSRWREYMFQRYIDIITKQAIYDAGRRTTMFTPSGVDQLLDDIGKRVYTDASESLYEFLFRERFSVDGDRPRVPPGTPVEPQVPSTEAEMPGD